MRCSLWHQWGAPLWRDFVWCVGSRTKRIVSFKRDATTVFTRVLFVINKSRAYTWGCYVCTWFGSSIYEYEFSQLNLWNSFSSLISCWITGTSAQEKEQQSSEEKNRSIFNNIHVANQIRCVFHTSSWWNDFIRSRFNQAASLLFQVEFVLWTSSFSLLGEIAFCRLLTVPYCKLANCDGHVENGCGFRTSLANEFLTLQNKVANSDVCV